MMEAGRMQYREALHRFKECQEKDQWPGFDTQILLSHSLGEHYDRNQLTHNSIRCFYSRSCHAHDDFSHCWRLANAASSRMVPEIFQEPPRLLRRHPARCRAGISPLTAVQNVFMIGGRPAYAKFAVALANRAKVFAGPIRWKVNKGEKKRLEVTLRATQ